MHRAGLSYITVSLSCIETSTRDNVRMRFLCGLEKIFTTNSRDHKEEPEERIYFARAGPENFISIMVANKNQYIEVDPADRLHKRNKQDGCGSRSFVHTNYTLEGSKKYSFAPTCSVNASKKGVLNLRVKTHSIRI